MTCGWSSSRDNHAGTRQEQTQHHAGGTAASDRALDVRGAAVLFYCTLTSCPRTTPPALIVECALK
jgi:hypothetical protein